MNLYPMSLAQLFFGATLQDPNPAPSPTVPNDPLVNQSWANFTHIAAIVFVIILVMIVGIVSKKVEHAIAFALIASLLLIGFFVLVGH
ncbi:MAG: hypothetical protein C4288_07900 [Leptolyngbya sp. ERB_1_1]